MGLPYLCKVWAPLASSRVQLQAVLSSRLDGGLRRETCKRVRASAQVRSLGWEDPLEEEKATHSSILAHRISWMEEAGVQMN